MSFAESWRRGRAISFAIMLVPFLLYLSYTLNKSEDKVVSETQIQALIKDVEFRGKKEYRHFKTEVQLPNGENITLLIAPSPAPRAGEKLPLK